MGEAALGGVVVADTELDEAGGGVGVAAAVAVGLRGTGGLADGEGGADSWYDSLPAGKYELTIQRTFACCDGPMVESNKISFEVIP